MTELVEEGGIRKGNPPALISLCVCGLKNCKADWCSLQPKSLKEEEEKHQEQEKDSKILQRMKQFFVCDEKEIKENYNHEEAEDGAHQFVKTNKKFFRGFKLIGIVNMKEKDGRYVVSEVRFIIAYILWILWPLIALVSYNRNQDEEEVNDAVLFIGNWMATFSLAVVPSLQAYSLKFINMYIPDFLEGVTTLCNIEVDFKIPLKFARKKLWQKLRGIESQMDKKCTYPEKLFQWLPVVMVISTLSIVIVMWCLGYLKYLDSNESQSELPALVYYNSVQVFPLMSTSFMNGLVRWFTTVYTKLWKHFRDKKEWNRQELVASLQYMEQLQEMFELLSVGFFRYTLTINLLCITVGAILCTANVFRDSGQPLYLEPVLLYVLALGAICGSCSDLMDKYEEWLKLLQKVCKKNNKKEDSGNFDEEWLMLMERSREHPPQVVTFGGYRVNRGLLVSLLGFILSYAVLVNQVTYRHTSTDPEECVATVLLALRNATDCCSDDLSFQ